MRDAYDHNRRFTRQVIKESVDLVVEYGMSYREAIYVMRMRGVIISLVTLCRWVTGKEFR